MLWEIIILIGVLAGIAAFFLPTARVFFESVQFQEQTSKLIQALQLSRAQSVAQEQGASYGVSFGATNNGVHEYTQYRGANYSERDPAFDVRTVLPPSIALNFSDTLKQVRDIHFAPNSGTPSIAASITIRHRTRGEKTIAVNALGIVGAAQWGSADIAAAHDATLHQHNPKKRTGKSRELYTQPSHIRRAVIQFNLQSIPAGAVINRATLSLYARSARKPVRDIAVHRVTAPWEEFTVTWNDAAEGRPWTNAGGDFDPVATDVQTAVRDWRKPFHRWTVTKDVQRFVSGEWQHYGWVLRDTNEADPDPDRAFWAFYSREGKASSESVPPSLEVEYSY